MQNNNNTAKGKLKIKKIQIKLRRFMVLHQLKKKSDQYFYIQFLFKLY